VIDVEYSYFRYLAEFASRLADLERAIGTPLTRTSVTAVSNRRQWEASHDTK
jgi:hypothetical protein